MKKCVISIAVGKPYYLMLAENLLRSFLLWNQENDINFLLLTDTPLFFDAFTQITKVHIQQINLAEEDKSFTSKFKLFEQAVADENLFIDCDCLIYKDIQFVFDTFKNKNFSTIGNNIFSGDFFCKVEHIIREFKIPDMPKFVGCIYYFKKNQIAESIFNKAITLKGEYDKVGFVRLNNKENEEPLISVAMAINGETPIPNDGSIKADMMYYKKITSNVITGKAILTNANYNITNGEDIPAKCYPAIVHFNGLYTYEYCYEIEVYRLNHLNQHRLLLQIISWTMLTLPHKIKINMKSIFRPAYRLLFGYRKILINVRGE